MKIEKPRQVIPEEYEEDIQPTMEKLAYLINPALESLYSVTDGNVDFNNLSWGLVTGLVVRVDANGKPDTTSGSNSVVSQFKNTAKKTPIGTSIISATCIDDSSLYPTSAPYMSISVLDTGLINIDNIRGLQPNKRYSLNVILITN